MVAWRLYLQEHGRRVALLLFGVLAIAVAAVLARDELRWPRLPLFLILDGYYPTSDFTNAIYFLPILIAPFIWLVPRIVHFMESLNERAVLFVSRAVQVVPSAFILLLVMLQRIKTQASWGEALIPQSSWLRAVDYGPLSASFFFHFNWAYWIICAIAPPLVLASLIDPFRPKQTLFRVAVTAWITCLVVVNATGWNIVAIEMSHPPYGDDEPTAVHLVSSLGLITLSAWLLVIKKTRLVIFCALNLIFVLLHVAGAAFLYGVNYSWLGELYACSFAAGIAFGKPPALWTFYSALYP